MPGGGKGQQGLICGAAAGVVLPPHGAGDEAVVLAVEEEDGRVAARRQCTSQPRPHSQAQNADDAVPRKAGLCPRRGLIDDGPPVCLVPAARCDALPLPAGDGRDAEIVKLRQDAAEQLRQAPVTSDDISLICDITSFICVFI
mgnify:CR=1 FL=1